MLKDRLSSNLITELFSAAIRKRSVFDILNQYLRFSYLQVEAEKKVWKKMTERYSKTGRVPTIGQLQQAFLDDEGVLELIENIRDVDVTDEDIPSLIASLEAYIRQMKFLDANDRIADSYNMGDKEKAYNILIKAAEEISHFTIQDAKYDRVFSDFNRRQLERRSTDWNYRFKIPTCIDELDYKLGGATGGPETGEAWLWMGISGAGKSQALVHLGIAASRQGYRVVHFQLEGTREQAMARYDSAWLGGIYQDVKVGNISDTKLKMAQRVVAKLGKTDIIVVAVESFGGMTVTQMRQELQDIERAYGKVDMILWDYLELAELGDGHSYSMNEERFRQMKLAQQAKMMAMEFNAVVHVATQANGIPPELLNDPDFVITRYNLAEAKGKVNPMDGFVTMNFTSDERKEEIMRLYLDKAREHKAGDIIRICNNMTYSRFYDRKRTLEMPWEDIVEEQHATKTKRGRRNTSVDDDE